MAVTDKPLVDISWTKTLRFLPSFSTEQIEKHRKGCGKKEIGSKGYKFFSESYVHNVYVGQLKDRNDNYIVKAKCYRSQRKNEEPHSLVLKCLNSDGKADITSTSCSCKAG